MLSPAELSAPKADRDLGFRAVTALTLNHSAVAQTNGPYDAAAPRRCDAVGLDASSPSPLRTKRAISLELLHLDAGRPGRRSRGAGRLRGRGLAGPLIGLAPGALAALVGG